MGGSGGGEGVCVFVCARARARVLGPVGGKCARECTHTPTRRGARRRGPLLAAVVRIIYRAPNPPIRPPSSRLFLFVCFSREGDDLGLRSSAGILVSSPGCRKGMGIQIWVRRACDWPKTKSIKKRNIWANRLSFFLAFPYLFIFYNRAMN